MYDISGGLCLTLLARSSKVESRNRLYRQWTERTHGGWKTVLCLYITFILSTQGLPGMHLVELLKTAVKGFDVPASVSKAIADDTQPVAGNKSSKGSCKYRHQMRRTAILYMCLPWWRPVVAEGDVYQKASQGAILERHPPSTMRKQVWQLVGWSEFEFVAFPSSIPSWVDW